MRERIDRYLGDFLMLAVCFLFQLFLLILAATDWLAGIFQGASND